MPKKHCLRHQTFILHGFLTYYWSLKQCFCQKKNTYVKIVLSRKNAMQKWREKIICKKKLTIDNLSSLLFFFQLSNIYFRLLTWTRTRRAWRTKSPLDATPRSRAPTASRTSSRWTLSINAIDLHDERRKTEPM